MAENTAKPFVKWAGGKKQILHEIRHRYPQGLGVDITRYAEPFVGGGAVLFDLLSLYRMKQVYISDRNPQLINAYTVVRDQPAPLVEGLEGMQRQYLSRDEEGRKAYYYEMRERYNGLIHREEGGAESAALFLFLNRTCYNGLYRVNRSGLFNVPAGRYKAPHICDGGNLKRASALLKGVEIVQGDYAACDDFVDKGTFVYFDPPYRPLTKTAAFTAYAQEPFGDDEQRRLAAFARKLADRGAWVLLSNSDPQNSDQGDCFFEEIYRGFHIQRIQASRTINSKTGGRGTVSELLISGYPAGTGENSGPYP